MERYNFWSNSLPLSSGPRWCLAGIGVVKPLQSCIPNFFRQSLRYFSWDMKMSLRCCLIWRPRKNFSSPIIDIWYCSCIIYPNSSLYFWLVQPKIISSTYIRHTNSSPLYVFVKRVGSREPGMKPLLFRKFLSVSYWAWGAYLRPYSALLSLYTMSGCFGSSKPGGCATYTSSSILPLRKALFTSIW